ncbi:MAG TPA: carboxylesterase family protein [Rhodopila sp.]|nr:carboxylesterase family protein [Rhodopila sp.]
MRRLLLLAILALAVPAHAAPPTAVTDTGLLSGGSGDGVTFFKGIPYAAAPVGALRWHAPEPPPAWQGTRDATAYGNDCMQEPVAGDAALPGAPLGEDCLYLNVWIPDHTPVGAQLPVLVWIHGGAYVNGSASAAIYDGSALARHGLVVVSLNYRLGRFGFFAHPALTTAHETPAANFALMDMQAALRWVRRNIAGFGGDPASVTVMGESAGGDAIMHLICWPEARALFARAIVLSGDGRRHISGGLPLRTDPHANPNGQPSAEATSLAFAAEHDIHGTGPEALAALRALPADTVLGGINMHTVFAHPPTATFAFGPIVDGAIVRDEPGRRLQADPTAALPILIGTTTDDLPLHRPPDPHDPLGLFGTRRTEARAAYDPYGTATPEQILRRVSVDLTMHEPARFVARHMAALGQPAWLYRFGYVPSAAQPRPEGTAHAMELPFLFGTLDVHYGANATPTDRGAARLFQAYIANFARSGDPNGPGLPAWQRADASTSGLMQIMPDGEGRFGSDPWQARLDLVAAAVDQSKPQAKAQSKPTTRTVTLDAGIP